MARSKPVRPRVDGIYNPRRPSRLTIRWTCCGIKLGETLVHVDRADDRVVVHVEPYGLLGHDDPAYPGKFQVFCPTCGSNTIMGVDHPGMKRTRELGEAYRAGRITDHTWIGDVKTMTTRPATARRLPEE